MLAEHFIEPEFLLKIASTRRNYKDFLREFSVQSPRVVGEVQKYNKFRSATLQAQPLAVAESEKGRLEELLNFIHEHCLVNRDFQYNTDDCVLDNFKAAHAQFNSDYFCLTQKPSEQLEGIQILCSTDVDDGFDEIPRQRAVEKTLESILVAVNSFLKLSTDITFVEPYFSLRPQMMNPIVSYLKTAVQHSPVAEKHAKVIFRGGDDAPTAEHLLNQLKDKLEGDFNKFDTFSVLAIEEKVKGEKIHNRYMISELGAIDWGIGLDCQDEGVFDDISLLESEGYNLRYRQYAELKGFKVIDYAQK